MQNNHTYLSLIGKIVAMGVMSFCGVVSETAMNVTFPTLMREFSITTDTVQWVTTGYLLILSLVITLSSYLKRNFTQRTLFFTAIGSFITATALCSWSPCFGVLIGGRMLQGIGTGIALPLMFNIVMEESPREKLGLFMGIATLITAMAPAVGPVFGGFVVEYLGWRDIFLILLIPLVLSLLIGARLFHPSKIGARSHFHVLDYLLIIIGYSAFIIAMVNASHAGWLSVTVITLLILAIAAMLLFDRRSRREPSPLLRFEIFRHSSFVCCLSAILVIQFATLAIGYAIPNYSQLVNHTGAFVAGCLLVPGCILGAVLAVVGGTIYDKLGPRIPIITGMSCLLLSMILFAIYGRQLTTMQFYLFYIVYTLGQGLSVGNMLTYSLSTLPKDLAPDGNALINSLQQLSGAAGTAVAATFVASAQAALPSDIATATAQGTCYTFFLLVMMIFLALVAATHAVKS
ncbi:MAG: DHA2 family efflux MFS transporter permease subunit [Prevotellaceae bacterium]|nr:DHA2 family efflux MFS transporter permease subunit [Prevotellaceae bacterium]